MSDIDVNIIDTLLEQTLADAKRLDEALLRHILAIIKTMDTEDGRILNNQRNRKLLSDLIKSSRKTLVSPKFNEIVDDLISHFDVVTQNNLALQAANDISITRAFITQQINPNKAITVNAVTAYLSQQSVNGSILYNINKVLSESVQFGYTITQMERRLTEQIVGVNGNNAGLTRHIGTISRDALFQYDGVINNVIANEFDLEGISYVGSLVKDSRSQCRRWVGKGTIKKSELRREIAWANRKGSGMIKGTTPDSFIVHRGGHNCRHRAIPVRLEED